jgi:hypothetical protein
MDGGFQVCVVLGKDLEKTVPIAKANYHLDNWVAATVVQ